MKILAVGDFHGRVPKGLNSFLKENPVDAIVCDGDLADADKIRDMQWKNWDKIKRKGDFEKLFKSKEEYVSTYTKTIESMKEPVNFLGNTGIKTFLVYGNADFPRNLTKKLKYKKYDSLEDYVGYFNNITLMHRRGINFGNHSIIGFSGYRGSSAKSGGNKKLTESFERHLEKLLSRYRKNAILVTHDAPYNTKIDKVENEDSPKYGKHMGDEIIRKAIEKYKPVLHICGHMHESQGKERIGRTLVVNPGYAREGEFALIKMNDKIKTGFCRLNK